MCIRDRLYAKPNVRTATANRYELIIETYTIPRIGNVKLKKLTTRHLQKLYKELLEEEIEQTRQEVRDYLGQPERRKLMQLVDAQNLLREKISLASFIAGFKLAQEIAKELEVAPHGKKTS